jgi:hypothetical protein
LVRLAIFSGKITKDKATRGLRLWLPYFFFLDPRALLACSSRAASVLLL